jgi:hypothetical protein
MPHPNTPPTARKSSTSTSHPGTSPLSQVRGAPQAASANSQAAAAEPIPGSRGQAAKQADHAVFRRARLNNKADLKSPLIDPVRADLISKQAAQCKNDKATTYRLHSKGEKRWSQ